MGLLHGPGWRIAAALLTAAALLCGCAKATSPSPSPTVAESVSPASFAAKVSKARSLQIEVFVRDQATTSQIAALKRIIIESPEIRYYTYASKDRALADFRKRLGEDADAVLANLVGNPLPASFDILVRKRSEVVPVAKRFFHEPGVFNSGPTKHDGVRWVSAALAKVLEAPGQ